MERKIEKFFYKWQKDIIRKPLILYGPKQVGKTFSTLAFGKKEYKNTVYFNSDNNIELSYIFDYDYWNNGYCTEACKELLKVLFNEMNINYVFARTIEGNNSSMKVLEKLGFNRVDLIDRIYIHTIRQYRNYYKYDLKRND